MQKRIDIYEGNYEETSYEIDDDSDFNSVMDALPISGYYEYDENDDGSAEYTTEQDNYALIEADDIEALAREVIHIVPSVEFHIEAVITVTFADGYDLCVDIDYVDGEMKVECSEEYYDNWENDEKDDFVTNSTTDSFIAIQLDCPMIKKYIEEYTSLPNDVFWDIISDCVRAIVCQQDAGYQDLWLSDVADPICALIELLEPIDDDIFQEIISERHYDEFDEDEYDEDDDFDKDFEDSFDIEAFKEFLLEHKDKILNAYGTISYIGFNREEIYIGIGHGHKSRKTFLISFRIDMRLFNEYQINPSAIKFLVSTEPFLCVSAHSAHTVKNNRIAALRFRIKLIPFRSIDSCACECLFNNNCFSEHFFDISNLSFNALFFLADSAITICAHIMNSF